jgi:hypothetical protein
MLIKWWEALRSFFYKLQDPNEEYICGFCGKETRPRVLYCSIECSELDEEEQRKVTIGGF